MTARNRDLVSHVEACIEKCRKDGAGVRLSGMWTHAGRTKAGLIKVMTSIVLNGDTLWGLEKVKALGHLDCSIESAILKFPGEFKPAVVECARWRLKIVEEG